MMAEFGEKLASVSRRIPSKVLGDEAYNYLYIKCSSCPYRESCTEMDSTNGGCGFRKNIYERLFSPIEFKTDDAIATNRLRLTSYYFTELMLMRTMGDKLTSEEIVLLKVALAELGKLYIDKRGDLMDQKTKTAVPWEQSPELDKLKREVEEARAIKEEYEKLRVQIAERKKKVQDGPDK